MLSLFVQTDWRVVWHVSVLGWRTGPNFWIVPHSASFKNNCNSDRWNSIVWFNQRRIEPQSIQSRRKRIFLLHHQTGWVNILELVEREAWFCSIYLACACRLIRQFINRAHNKIAIYFIANDHKKGNFIHELTSCIAHYRQLYAEKQW